MLLVMPTNRTHDSVSYYACIPLTCTCCHGDGGGVGVYALISCCLYVWILVTKHTTDQLAKVKNPMQEMRLVSAILVYLITQYLKLFLLVALICSLLRYSNGSRHVYVIVSEFVLALVLALIMFASLALTKMHSNRIANYLLLPVLLGLGYINAAHYQRHTDGSLIKMPPTPPNTSPYNNDLEVESGSGNPMDGSLVDSIELFACNGLASLSVMLLMGNLFNRQLAKLLD